MSKCDPLPYAMNPQRSSPLPSGREANHWGHYTTTSASAHRKTEKYRYYWAELTKSQNKMETYVALNRKYTVETYLTPVSDIKLTWTLTEQWTDLDAQRQEVVFLLWAANSWDRAVLPNLAQLLGKSKRPVLYTININIPRVPLSKWLEKTPSLPWALQLREPPFPYV